MIELFLTALENLFYLTIRKIFDYVSLKFPFKLIFLDIYMWFSYLFSSPFSLAKREGTTIGGRAPQGVLSEDELTYGETLYLTAYKILERVGVTSADVFLDIGCGRGKVVFFVDYFYNIPAIGIEVLPTFIKKALKIKQILSFKNSMFLRGDFREVALPSSATIVYCSGTCFTSSTFKQLILKLESLPRLSKVISLTHPLDTSFLSLRAKEELHFSWGKGTVYYYSKKEF